MVILHEMYHQRRIIPIDGRPPTGLPQWNGEPRGRWEGSTLVVESRYFPDRSQDRFRHIWRAPAASLHVVERFTRVDTETLDYEATITDPTRFYPAVDRPLSAVHGQVGAGGGGGPPLRVCLPRGELRDQERPAWRSRPGHACCRPLIVFAFEKGSCPYPRSGCCSKLERMERHAMQKARHRGIWRKTTRF